MADKQGMRAWIKLLKEPRWLDFLSSHQDRTEVCWKQRSNAIRIKSGELFLIRTNLPKHNGAEPGTAISGGGIFSGHKRLKLSEAWQDYGIANGYSSWDEKLRLHRAPDEERDPYRTCLILTDLFRLPQSQWIERPAAEFQAQQTGVVVDLNEADWLARPLLAY